MNPYEILVMLDPDLAEERQAEIIDRMRELVEKGGGAWLSHDPWGRRKLAYEIRHKDEGIYHFVTLDAAPETLAEISRVLKITDGVMRHMPTRRSEGPSAPRTAPAATAAASVQATEYPANTRSQEEE